MTFTVRRYVLSHWDVPVRPCTSVQQPTRCNHVQSITRATRLSKSDDEPTPHASNRASLEDLGISLVKLLSQRIGNEALLNRRTVPPADDDAISGDANVEGLTMGYDVNFDNHNHLP